MVFCVRRVEPPLAGIRPRTLSRLLLSDKMESVLGKEPPVAVVAGVQHLPEEAVLQDPQATLPLQVGATEIALEEIALHAIILHSRRLRKGVFEAKDQRAHKDKSTRTHK